MSNAATSKPSIKKPLVIIKKTATKDTIDSVKTCPSIIVNKTKPSERLAQFYKLKSDLPKKNTVHFSIEKPLKLPMDTLRCPECNKLFLREHHEQHKKECTMKVGHKYGCVYCHYKHTDIEELRKHISNCHNRKELNFTMQK